MSNCILYDGWKNKDGYGVAFGWNKKTKKSFHKLAHRIAWETQNGDIPKGMSICHKCDVRDCVNVEHLFLGTQADNMRDKASKGRQSRGKEHSEKIKAKVPLIPQKLDWVKVKKIRRLAGTKTLRALATMFGVSSAMVWKIIHNTVWHPKKDAGYQK